MSEEEEVVVDPTQAKLDALPKLEVRQNDLPEHLWTKVKLLLGEALEHKMEKDIAKHIKVTMDEDPDFNELPGKGPWQVIVGKSFTLSLTHEAGHIVFFDVVPMRESILIFKSLRVQAE